MIEIKEIEEQMYKLSRYAEKILDDIKTEVEEQKKEISSLKLENERMKNTIIKIQKENENLKTKVKKKNNVLKDIKNLCIGDEIDG